MKKKVLSILLCMAIILGTVPMFAMASSGPSYFQNGKYIYKAVSDTDTSAPPVKGSEAVSDTVSKKFGTKGADGRIWADKTVNVGSNGDFDVTLSALAQEYESEITSNKTKSLAADVVFILDFTGSMTDTSGKDITLPNNTKEYRLKALADAFNIAAGIISAANPKNRMLVYTFNAGNDKTSGNCDKLMDFGHYESSTGNYLTFNDSTKKVSCPLSNGVTRDGNPFSFAEKGASGWTSSQYGISNSVNGLISEINNEITDSSIKTPRKPFVIFMTDGAATGANSNWKGTSTPQSSYTAKDSSQGDSSVSALTILSGAYWKSQLQAKYDSYNLNDARKEKASDELSTYPVDWFNIGIGVNKGTYPNVDTIVDPDLVINRTGYSGSATTLNSVQTKIESFDSNSEYTKLSVSVEKDWGSTEPAEGTTVTVELKRNNASLSPAKTVTLSADNDWKASFDDLPRKSGSTTYTYSVSEGSDTSGTGTLIQKTTAGYKYANYSDFCTTQETVNGAFEDLARIIEAASAETNYPVTQTSTGDGISGMEFTDVIGEGFTLGVPVLTGYKKVSATSNERRLATAKGVETTEGSGEYTFAGFEATAKYTASSRTLVWNIPAPEIGTYAYADRKNLSAGNAYTAASPSTLKYTVTCVGEAKKDYYTNDYSGDTAGTTVEYTVSGDNYFYFDKSTFSQNSFGEFNGSHFNGDFSSSKPEDVEKGTDNKTATVSKVRAYTYTPKNEGEEDVHCNVLAYLGNNGKASPELEVTKTVDRDETSPNCEYIYNVTIKNLTNATNGTDYSDVVISDKLTTDVVGITYSGKVNSSDDITESSGALTINAGTISKGSTKTISYIVKVPSTATNGQVIKAVDPIVSKIGTAETGAAFAVDESSNPVYNTNLNVKVKIVKIPVKKVWKGDSADYSSTTVTFTLYNDKNTETKTANLSSSNSWEYEFNPLPKYITKKTTTGGVTSVSDKTASLVTYSVDETSTPPSGYSKLNSDKIPAAYTDATNPEKADKITITNEKAKKVTYFWESGTTGKTLPTALNDELPGNITGLFDGDTYTSADGYGTATPHVANDKYYVYKTGTTDVVVETWTFGGWEDTVSGTTSGEIDGADGKFEGVWTCEDATHPYKVTYSWESGTTGKTLPTGLDSQKPGNITNLYDKQTYTSAAGYGTATPHVANDKYYVYKTGTTDVVVETWTFGGWEDTVSGTTSGKINAADGAFEGVWTCEDGVKYSTDYEWSLSDGSVIPSGLDAQLTKPTGGKYYKNEKYDTDTTYKGDPEPTKIKATETDAKEYLYTFTGWKPYEPGSTTPYSSEKMPESSLVFKGEWTVEPSKNITYVFDGPAPEGVTTPEFVKPTDNANYYDGDSYKVDEDNKLPVGTKVVDKDNVTWVFDGWDTTDGKVSDNDIVIKGTWTKTDPGKVTYTYAGGLFPEGYDLPGDNNTYPVDSTYPVSDMYVGKVFTDSSDNKWTFEGWTDTNPDPDKKMPTEGVVISGKWTKEAAKSITYKYDDSVPADIPLPTDDYPYHDGEKFFVKDPEKTVYYDDDGNKWTFDGWDTTDGIIDGSDVVIRGKWTKEEPKKIEIDWGDIIPPTGVDDKDIIDDKPYYNGDDYKPKTDDIPKGTEVIDKDGNKWIFDGFDTDGGTVDDDDVVIKAKWTKEEPKTAEIDWGSFTPDDVDDDDVIKSGPYYDGDEYKTDYSKIPKGKEYTDDDGNKWTFEGFEPDEGKVDGKDVVIKAKWKETPKHDVTAKIHTEKDPDGEVETAVLDEGEIIKVVPNEGDWDYEYNHYSGDDIAEIVVTKDMVIDDPVREGYTFKGWVVTEEDGVKVLTAEWEPNSNRKFNILPYIIPAGIIGGVTATAIGGGITAAIVGGSIIAAPVVVIGGIHIAKNIADKNQPDNNTDDNTDNSTEETQVPDTGSHNTVLYAAIAAIIVAAGAAFVVIKKKKEN